MVSERIADWIPRQSCNTATQVSDFRQRMEKAVASLVSLNFKREAEVLQQQTQRAIMQVEERQRFAITLAKSDDYPRQPDPTESTLVRELRDGIAKGDRLIESIHAAQAALNGKEIAARVNAVKQFQMGLKAMLDRRRQALGSLYNATLDNETSLQETLIKTKRLRDIFIDTPDENELNDLVVQLEHIQTDVSAWETGDVSTERLTELLQQQIPHQLLELAEFFEAREIEPAWDMEAVYQAIATERVGALRRRSTEWVLPKLVLEEQIPQMEQNHCKALEQELANAPPFLSAEDRQHIERLSNSAKQRREELDERQRQAKVTAWQEQFLSLWDIGTLDLHRTEQHLKVVRNPPCELLPQEQMAVEPVLANLTAHLDQLSVDEIIGRIERLPVERQRELLALLSERLHPRSLQ